MDPRPKTGFTWTELLVLVSVIGFLAAVLVPSFLRMHEPHHRAVTASNVRQIGQASLIYANDNREKLPGLHLTPMGEIDPDATTPDIHAITAALARKGGLNDASMWIIFDDPHPDVIVTGLGPILHRGPPETMDPLFMRSALSYQYVAGLDTGMHSMTPIAFTRGLQRDGKWAGSPQSALPGGGGHMVFLGGNVMYYERLDPVAGPLVDQKGSPTSDMLKAVGSEARIFSHPATATGALDGMPGIDP